jgi:hypothetical protein
MKRLVAWLLVLGSVLAAGAQAQPMVFRYVAMDAVGDHRRDYFWDLLKAALEANRREWGDFVLQPHPGLLAQQRAVAELDNPDGLVNIIVRTSNPVLAQTLLPVNLPLDKGLVGFRLFLVMPATQQRLDRLSQPEALKGFSVGQGSAWPDPAILRHAGFQKLVLTESYPNHSPMLLAGRFDLFPRGVSEISDEMKTMRAEAPGMVVEHRFALHYPLAIQFYVARSPQGEKMAARVRDGLLRLKRSGAFDVRYAAYKKQVLQSLPLAGRRVMRLDNPDLPTGLPAFSDKGWWDDLSAERKTTL